MRTEQETKIFNEIYQLKKAGVRFELLDADRYPGKHGDAKLHSDRVSVSISYEDTIDEMADYLIKAGELVDKLSDIKSHEKQHPDFMTALRSVIYG